MFFGGVAAALRGADGRLEAAADGRREGAVLVVE
jgi:gamma-glutamyltranspeptidase